MKYTVWGITWASWHYVWYMLLIACCMVVVIIARYVKKRNVARLLGFQHVPMLLHFSLAKQAIKMMLWLLAVSCLSIALLQPQWNKKEEHVEQHGRDVIIALDVSRSMLAQDYSPSRLAYAKEKIQRLLSRLSCERVGLILFSGSAFVQCPLTQDIAAFSLFLQQVDAQTISAGTTAVDQAIIKALDVFAAIGQRKNKLLVIVTDGEDYSSNLVAIKQRAQEVGLHIFTMGIGTQHGAPIPVIDADGKQIGHEQDAAGAVVMSRLNEGILRTLAEDVGGIYVRATPNDADIDLIAAKVDQYEKEAFDTKKVASHEEQYPWFVGAAFVFFLLEWMV